jgi:hypothetical protein
LCFWVSNDYTLQPYLYICLIWFPEFYIRRLFLMTLLLECVNYSPWRWTSKGCNMLELGVVLFKWCPNHTLIHLWVLIWCRDISARIWTGWTLHRLYCSFSCFQTFSNEWSSIYIYILTSIIQNISRHNMQRVVMWHTVRNAARSIVKILPVAVHALYKSLTWRTGRGSSGLTLVSKISKKKKSYSFEKHMKITKLNKFYLLLYGLKRRGTLSVYLEILVTDRDSCGTAPILLANLTSVGRTPSKSRLYAQLTLPSLKVE